MCRAKARLLVCTVFHFIAPPGTFRDTVDFHHGTEPKAFFIEVVMTEKITYNREAAESLGSAVAAILLTHIIKKCEEKNTDTIEATDIQFDLGFADVEFFSALKTLRDNGYMRSRMARNGVRIYEPIPDLLILMA